MASKAIQPDDIISPNVFDPAKKSAEQLLLQTGALIDSFKQLATITGKKISFADPKSLKDASDLAEAMKKIDILEKGMAAAKQAQQAINISAQKIKQEELKVLQQKEILSQRELKTEADIRKEYALQEAAIKKANKEKEKAEILSKKLGSEYTINRNKLKELRDEMLKEDFGSQRFKELSEQAGKIDDKLSDARNSVKAFSTESKLAASYNLFGQVGSSLANLDFSQAAEQTKLLRDVVSTISFKDLIGGVKNFGNAILDLGKVLIANPFTLIVSGIAAVAFAIKNEYDAYKKYDEIIKNANENIQIQIEKNKSLAQSILEAERANRVLIGSLSQVDKEKLDRQDEFKSAFIKNANEEISAIKKINDEAKKANESTITESLLGGLGSGLRAKRISDNNAKVQALISSARKTYAENERQLKEQLYIDEKNINARNKINAKETLINKKQEVDESIKIQIDAHNALQKINEDFIKYELEAIEGKYGEAEKIIAKKELADKIDLNDYTQVELDAWVSMKKKAYDEQKEIQNDFIKYELEAIEGKYGEAEKIIAEKELADKIALGIETPSERAEWEKLKAAAVKQTDEKKILAAVNYQKEITKGIQDGIKERAAIRQAADQKDIDILEKQIQAQQALAAQGKDNVLAETISKQAQAEEKKIQDQKKAAKAQETIALIQTFSSALKSALDSGDKFLPAFGKALAAEGAVSNVFAKLITGFYDGTEYLSADDGINVGGEKDNILIRAHKGERILGVEDSSMIPQGMSNEDVVRASRMYVSNDDVPKITASDFQAMQILAMTNEIKMLREDMRNRPVQSVQLNRLGEWTEKINSDATTKIIYHKRNNNRPSLRLNG